MCVVWKKNHLSYFWRYLYYVTRKLPYLGQKLHQISVRKNKCRFNWKMTLHVARLHYKILEITKIETKKVLTSISRLLLYFLSRAGNWGRLITIEHGGWCRENKRAFILKIWRPLHTVQINLTTTTDLKLEKKTAWKTSF